MASIMPPQELSYDIIEGISAGAMNAGILGTFEVGDEFRAIKWLEELWSVLPASAVWNNWPYMGPVEIFWRPSLLDNTPAYNIFKQVLGGRKFERQIALLSVDMNTGEIIIFDETTPEHAMVDAVISSTSIPSIFPLVAMDHKQLGDGGVFANLDISESIIKCRENGFKDEDIIIDVIMCFDHVIKIP